MPFEGLVDAIQAAPWAYLIAAGLVALDAIFPLVPGETALIAAGILAADGELALPLVLAAGIAGAGSGDQLSYLLGRSLGARRARRMLAGARERDRVARASAALRERRVAILVGARFVPGGRTAVTFASGAVGMRWRDYTAADLLGVALWALYAVMVGYLGGEAFDDSAAKSLAAALGVAAGVALIAEVVRRLRAEPPCESSASKA